MPSKTQNITPAKGTIKSLDDPGQVFVFQFNPTEFSEARTVNWEPKKATLKNIPFVEYTGGNNGKISLELLLDAYEQPQVNHQTITDVRFFTKKLEQYLKPTVKSTNNQEKRKRPPYLLFQWGQDYQFKAVLTSLSVTFNLFLQDGTPVRARARIELLQVADEQQPGTNPTSYARPGYKSRMVERSDSLPLIAFAEYGDPNEWRRIADANNIDDPTMLRVGDIIAIPPID